MRLFKSFVGVLVFSIAASTCAYAQGVGASGDIRGTVTDATGANVPNATVTATETQKGLKRSAVSDTKGEYYIAGLAPGTYDVSAQLSGFQTSIQKGVIVNVGQTVVLDFHIKVSQVAEQVEVTTEAPIVETEKSHQADTINEQYIRDLPINRRDYLTFTLLMPGATDSTRLASDQDFRVKQTPQSGLSFYGSNGRGNNVTVDGGEANGDTGGVRPTLSQDAVQEFQINRSNYSAELGGGSGASINIVSKSGSNNLHGSLYGFFRDDVFDARNPFSFSQALQPGQTFNPANPDSAGVPVKDALNRQQFGGSAGFPITKDKTFLFAAFEGLRQDAQNAVPLLTNTNIFRPTAAQQAALTPAQISALTIKSSAFGGTALDDFLINSFESNGGLFPFNTRQYLASGRFDHQFSDRNQIFLRYSYAHDLEENPDVQSLTGFSRGSSIHTYDHTIQGAWFHQFSANTSNEARGQWNYDSFNVIPTVLGQAGLDIPGFGNLGNQIFIPSISILRRPEFADNLTMIRGHHTMKFGGAVLSRGNHTESHTFFPGRFVFGSLPGAVAGFPTIAINSLQSAAFGDPQFYQQGFDNPTTNYARPFTAAYWQDSWALRSNFTFNFGVRYELDVQYGNLSTDKDNIAPRVSFAWDPFKNHKTVVRGGFGMFYGTVDRQITDVVNYLGIVNGFRQIAQVFTTFGATATSANHIFQTLFAQGKMAPCTLASGQAACITPADLTQFGIAITHTGPIPPLSVIFSAQPGYQNPYSEQGEFGIERQLFGGVSVSASYIYVHTLKIPVSLDTNNAKILQLPLAQQFVPAGPANIPIRQWGASNPNCAGANIVNCFVNPLLLQTDQYSSAGSSLYQGGILEIKKRFSNNYTLIGNYTYSKAFDTTTDFNSDFSPADQTCLSCERSLSTFDQRHKVVVAGVFDSPWKGRILSGFELSPIVRYNSAHPFNLLAGSNVNNDRHSTNDRPPGAGRNTGIGPNYVAFDMRLSRQFKVTEKANLQLIAEGFNIFNRTNFGSVNNVVGVIGPDPALGFNLHGNRSLSPSQPLGFTSAQPMRQLQFGARLSF
ncbi:MAG TPA: TonB-dependent receptor [Candidatus Acidoferrales bacterium]|nr:TonB-dependent receptor [Candidatus Acidoferrales bacterium]